MSTRLRALAIAVTAATLFAGTAAAGHLTSGVKSYTGCIVPKDGVIIKIKEGDAPASPCTGGQTLAHISGGDITKVTAGAGLTGGGDNGEVTLSLAPAFRLPQGCTNAQVAKWDGDSWECAADQNTTYTAGTGLALNGTELRIAAGYQLPQDCDDGDGASAFDGSWECNRFVFAGVDCPANQFVRGSADDGTLHCAAPPASSNTYVSVSPGDWSLGEGSTTVIASLSPGAGTYLVIAKGTIRTNGDATDFETVECDLFVDSSQIDRVVLAEDNLDSGLRFPFTLTGAAPISSGFSVKCLSDVPGTSVVDIKLVGVKL